MNKKGGLSMFGDILDNITRRRASISRDAEYISENVRDSDLQEAVLEYESVQDGLYLESEVMPVELRKEIRATIEQIPDNAADEQAEIDRIVSSNDEMMNLDAVMGIKSDADAEMAPMIDAVGELKDEVDFSAIDDDLSKGE